MREGDVIRIDDRLTGFDDNKIGRPYCVVRVLGEPWGEIYVVPRTTERTPGAAKLAKGVIRGLNKDGWFLFRSYRLTPEDIRDVEPVGSLPKAVFENVREIVNLAEFDID